MINGFVKIDRKIIDWEWYRDLPTRGVFMHCLVKANWKDGRFMGFDIPRGSFVTSINNLAFENGLTVQQVRTALSKLEKTGEIIKKSTNSFTIIYVVNYEKYQQSINNQSTNEQQPKQQQNNKRITNIKTSNNAGFDDLENQHQQTNNKRITNEQQTNNKRVTTIEEYKEYKEDKNYNNHMANADSSGCGGNITFVFNAAFGRSPNPTEQKTVNLLVNRYGSGWVEEALTMTAEAGKDLRYAKGILTNWEERGKDPKKKQDVKKQLESERQNETDYNDIYNIYN